MMRIVKIQATVEPAKPNGSVKVLCAQYLPYAKVTLRGGMDVVPRLDVMVAEQLQRQDGKLTSSRHVNSYRCVCSRQDSIMKKDVKHVTKDCPGPKLSFGQCRVNHDTNSTSKEDDRDE